MTGRNDNSSTIRGGKIEWRRSFPRRSNRLRRIHRYYPVEDDAEDAEVIICPARADLMRDTALKEARQFSEGSAGRQEGLGCANGCVEEGAQGATRRCRESTSPWSLLVRGQKAKGKEPAPWAVKGFEHMIAYTDVRPSGSHWSSAYAVATGAGSSRAGPSSSAPSSLFDDLPAFPDY